MCRGVWVMYTVPSEFMHNDSILPTLCAGSVFLLRIFPLRPPLFLRRALSLTLLGLMTSHREDFQILAYAVTCITRC